MSPVRIAGIVLAAISGLTILYNVAQSSSNFEMLEKNPLSVLEGNLVPAYTFTPPFTGFEILVMLGGVAGVLMIILGRNKPT